MACIRLGGAAGVFVNNAGAAAKTQRDYIIEKDAAGETN